MLPPIQTAPVIVRYLYLRQLSVSALITDVVQGIVFSTVILRVSRGISIGDEGSSHELAALHMGGRRFGGTSTGDGVEGVTDSHAKHTSIDKTSLKSTATEVV